jgi:predicted YcjX-like family ATPase
LAAKWRTVSRRIGITGLRGSGKTVFLTSLINHLKDHDPFLLPLGPAGQARISNFRFRPLAPGKAAFNYEAYRDAIVNHGEWPRKTRDAAWSRFGFERSDWRVTRAEVELYDFPGERIADGAMIEARDYLEWSRYVLRHFEDLADYRVHAAEFLDLIGRDQIVESEVIHAYKLTLGRLINHYKPLISPSTFLLGPDGDAAAPGDAEDLAASRICGQDESSQFTPLSEEGARANPQLAKAFAARFERYRREVAAPVFNYLKQCHRLIVLVDTPTLLAAGTGMFNDNLKIMEDLFTVLDPRSSLLGRMVKSIMAATPLGWRPGGITRVFFAAAKADLVHPGDRDRLLGLLRSMTSRLSDGREGVKVAHGLAAAVLSTEEVPGGRMLAGYPVYDEKGGLLPPGGTMRKFAVSALPEQWPSDWREGDFTFVRVYPNMPRRVNLAPPQIGMARILDFILAESFGE